MKPTVGERIVAEARTWLDTPYIWGGQSRAGVDCSGFVQCVLSKFGLDPPEDQTAQGLHDHFASQEGVTKDVRSPGALVFFGKDTKHISHVGFVLDESYMIEAAGGNSLCRTVEDALQKNAKVKISRIDRRNDLAAIIGLDAN